jgi:AcrR family transcriptional regulator
MDAQQQGGAVTSRGSTTRAKLIAATTQVVSQVGYAHATTKAIAHAAGVAEGTIYRHFPTKTSLFYAAVLDRNSDILAELAQLPARAGTATVADNLTHTLHNLAGLRGDILPLEFALMTDPELANHRHPGPTGAAGADAAPHFIAQYLTAEQALGRVRPDLQCDQIEVILLALLLGIALSPAPEGSTINEQLLDTAIHTLVEGLKALAAGEVCHRDP